MRYVDIKDHVISISHHIDLMPVNLMEELLSYLGGVPSGIHALRDREHTRIKRITHAEMYTGMDNYHVVCSLLMDDVPAFFFVAGGLYGESYYRYYILNVEACKVFARYLIEESSFNDLEEVEVVDDIPDLTGFHGVEILYGATYSRDNTDRKWVKLL